jgi:DNA mismatch repair protein MutS
MAGSENTPLMKQYNSIKERYPNSVLLFRLGDFYETFGDDAKITANACGIALTKRNNGAGGDMPLAGFPYHQLDNYLPKLVQAGNRVAVCEQLEDPKLAKGIVKRDVVEVVTPGVAVYDRLLDSKNNNFLVAINIAQLSSSINLAGLAFCDISTGEFQVGEFPVTQLKDVLSSLSPNEIIINKEFKYELTELINSLPFSPTITRLDSWIFETEFAKDLIKKHADTKNLKGFGIENLSCGVASIGAILHYVSETQSSYANQLSKISIYNPTDYMLLDSSTRRNLEIYQTAKNSKDTSLFSIVDDTLTPMGSRLVRKWLNNPLINQEKINYRLGLTTVFFTNDFCRQEFRNLLSQISDLERLIAKVTAGRANPKDIVNLKNSIEIIPIIKELSLRFENNVELLNIIKKLSDCSEFVSYCNYAINEEVPVQLGTGNLFRTGFNQQLTEFVRIKFDSKNIINDIQAREREATGLSSLKVGFNNVFGYYFEISKVQARTAPTYFERRQTLTNAERFTTPELKELESKILSAEEKILELEQLLFRELLDKVIFFKEEILNNAKLIAEIDCLQGFANVAKEMNFTLPVVNLSSEINIINGRHPVVERFIGSGNSFTPNDTYLNSDSEQIHIITGPNMAGKSCYLRQVGIIVLLAQCGCYVPADSAEIGIVDRIFTRVGAQDSITTGESTFLVEMQEVANILNNATSKSLLLLDEVGRGTATYDGISIAWAITEFIHNNTYARTLFATHYHELNAIKEQLSRVVNYKVEVIEEEEIVLFTHKVLRGSSNHSFGIHVAKMAGVPQAVVERANLIMKQLEIGDEQLEIEESEVKSNIRKIANVRKDKQEAQLSIFEYQDDKLRQRLREISLDNLSPIQAFQILIELKNNVAN